GRDRGPRRGRRGAQRPLRGNGRPAAIGRPSRGMNLLDFGLGILDFGGDDLRVFDGMIGGFRWHPQSMIPDRKYNNPRYDPPHSREFPKMDRRDFLKQTAAAGTGSFLLGGGPAFARSLRPSPNERVRFACIGVGGKGQSDTLDASKHGEIVG